MQLKCSRCLSYLFVNSIILQHKHMVKTNRFIYGIMTSPTVHVYLFIAVTMFVVGNKALGVFLLEKNEKKKPTRISLLQIDFRNRFTSF